MFPFCSFLLTGSCLFHLLTRPFLKVCFLFIFIWDTQTHRNVERILKEQHCGTASRATYRPHQGLTRQEPTGVLFCSPGDRKLLSHVKTVFCRLIQSTNWKSSHLLSTYQVSVTLLGVLTLLRHCQQESQQIASKLGKRRPRLREVSYSPQV